MRKKLKQHASTHSLTSESIVQIEDVSKLHLRPEFKKKPFILFFQSKIEKKFLRSFYGTWRIPLLMLVCSAAMFQYVFTLDYNIIFVVLMSLNSAFCFIGSIVSLFCFLLWPKRLTIFVEILISAILTIVLIIVSYHDVYQNEIGGILLIQLSFVLSLRLRFLFVFILTSLNIIAHFVLRLVFYFLYFHSELLVIFYNISMLLQSLFVLMSIFFLELGERDAFINQQILQSQKNRLRQENVKMSVFLLNIIPYEYVEKCKKQDFFVSVEKKQNSVVVISDFKDFTLTSKHMSSARIIHSLNFHFKFFDALSRKLGLTKIKTIGDSFFCVGYEPSTSSSASSSISSIPSNLDLTNNINNNNNSNNSGNNSPSKQVQDLGNQISKKEDTDINVEGSGGTNDQIPTALPPNGATAGSGLFSSMCEPDENIVSDANTKVFSAILFAIGVINFLHRKEEREPTPVEPSSPSMRIPILNEMSKSFSSDSSSTIDSSSSQSLKQGNDTNSNTNINTNNANNSNIINNTNNSHLDHFIKRTESKSNIDDMSTNVNPKSDMINTPLKNNITSNNEENLKNVESNVSNSLTESRSLKDAHGIQFFDIRFGVSEGEVSLAVFKKDFLNFEVFGEAVTSAKKLEASCKKNCVNLHTNLYTKIKGHFDVELNESGYIINVQEKGMEGVILNEKFKEQFTKLCEMIGDPSDESFMDKELSDFSFDANPNNTSMTSSLSSLDLSTNSTINNAPNNNHTSGSNNSNNNIKEKEKEKEKDTNSFDDSSSSNLKKQSSKAVKVNLSQITIKNRMDLLLTKIFGPKYLKFIGKKRKQLENLENNNILMKLTCMLFSKEKRKKHKKNLFGEGRSSPNKSFYEMMWSKFKNFFVMNKYSGLIYSMMIFSNFKQESQYQKSYFRNSFFSQIFFLLFLIFFQFSNIVFILCFNSVDVMSYLYSVHFIFMYSLMLLEFFFLILTFLNFFLLKIYYFDQIVSAIVFVLNVANLFFVRYLNTEDHCSACFVNYCFITILICFALANVHNIFVRIVIYIVFVSMFLLVYFLFYYASDTLFDSNFILMLIDYFIIAIFYFFYSILLESILRFSFSRELSIQLKRDMIKKEKLENEKIILSALPKRIFEKLIYDTNENNVGDVVINDTLGNDCVICFCQLVFPKEQNASLFLNDKSIITQICNIFLDFDSILIQKKCLKIKSVWESYLFIKTDMMNFKTEEENEKNKEKYIQRMKSLNNKPLKKQDIVFQELIDSDSGKKEHYHEDDEDEERDSKIKRKEEKLKREKEKGQANLHTVFETCFSIDKILRKRNKKININSPNFEYYQPVSSPKNTPPKYSPKNSKSNMTNVKSNNNNTSHSSITSTSKAISLFAKFGVFKGGCSAGVIGYDKLLYDCVGSSVNTASRLCTNFKFNKIQNNKIHIIEGLGMLGDSLKAIENNPKFSYDARNNAVFDLKGIGPVNTCYISFHHKKDSTKMFNDDFDGKLINLGNEKVPDHPLKEEPNQSNQTETNKNETTIFKNEIKNEINE